MRSLTGAVLDFYISLKILSVLQIGVFSFWNMEFLSSCPASVKLCKDFIYFGLFVYVAIVNEILYPVSFPNGLFCIALVVLGTEPRASHMLGKGSITVSLSSLS